MTLAPDPALCPVCGNPNACAMEAQRATGKAQPPCWCTQLTISPAALARIPAAARDRACLCPQCAAFSAVVPTPAAP